MITTIYKRALAVLMKKPIRLWGISILSTILTSIMFVLFGVVLGVALAINLAITTSMTMIYLKGYRGEESESADLFICLKDGATAKRVIGGMAWMMLWTFIWGLVPIVGPILSIMKAYSYRLTPYILTLEHDVKITDAIKVSEKRTLGYRGKMFLADYLFYFIIALAYIVLGILSGVMADAGLEAISGLIGLIMVLGVIAIVILAPLFIGLVQAAFYEEIMAESARREAAEQAAFEARMAREAAAQAERGEE